MYGVGLAELQIAWVNFTKLGERTVVDKPDVPVLQRDDRPRAGCEWSAARE